MTPIVTHASLALPMLDVFTGGCWPTGGSLQHRELHDPFLHVLQLLQELLNLFVSLFSITDLKHYIFTLRSLYHVCVNSIHISVGSDVTWGFLLHFLCNEKKRFEKWVYVVAFAFNLRCILGNKIYSGASGIHDCLHLVSLGAWKFCLIFSSFC